MTISSQILNISQVGDPNPLWASQCLTTLTASPPCLGWIPCISDCTHSPLGCHLQKESVHSVPPHLLIFSGSDNTSTAQCPNLWGVAQPDVWCLFTLHGYCTTSFRRKAQTVVNVMLRSWAYTGQQKENLRNLQVTQKLICNTLLYI